MGVILGLLIGLLIGATGWAVAMNRAWNFAHDYAVSKADALDIADPRGSAYSDMATVMVLALDRSGRKALTRENTDGEG